MAIMNLGIVLLFVLFLAGIVGVILLAKYNKNKDQ